ncbi:hypothetical protein GPECTOR_88g462 [Gonium pectorale]|uniref:Uncharacterized protein n=1 Tax=Gonium pectorale TaxID=33097 RepID=A0A150G0Y8_GONPE|nr:hypothetical protein GPECTOR_88g462 [Gonium pectorale]|eukprot:KXZ43519.1 hypothetical protein GPECTOR_88g462 [Gonium pectorale]
MTWKTPRGDRILRGCEAKLYASALATMMDFETYSGGEGLNWGEPLAEGPFERLTLAQQYTVLEEVSYALLKPTPSCLFLTAIRENAVFYVYAWLQGQFADDCESAEEVWGPLVLEALRKPARDTRARRRWDAIACARAEAGRREAAERGAEGEGSEGEQQEEGEPGEGEGRCAKRPRHGREEELQQQPQPAARSAAAEATAPGAAAVAADAAPAPATAAAAAAGGGEEDWYDEDDERDEESTARIGCMGGWVGG